MKKYSDEKLRSIRKETLDALYLTESNSIDYKREYYNVIDALYATIRQVNGELDRRTNKAACG